ncbi:hypothetical protein [Chondromyces crocatus]|uniref:hypothetical protein n=1 Tax=Chondromyces crocatus TaxID=52 RepID=UPI00067D1799|nr:hypothetical protein [Chondromyces crocatus]
MKVQRLTMGGHSVTLEPPDISRVVLRGDISAMEMLSVLGIVRAFAEERGRVFLLIDARGLGGIPVDARKAICEGASIPIRGTAIYGASFQSRILCTLVMGALQLFTTQHDNPVVFLPDEESAFGWVTQRRASLDAMAVAS